jgi:hypothetical protein
MQLTGIVQGIPFTIGILQGIGKPLPSIREEGKVRLGKVQCLFKSNITVIVSCST